MNRTQKTINQRVCYNRIWSWSPMPCEKHGPRASVTTKTSAFGLGFCLLSPSGHVFHTAWETMIKSYITWLAFQKGFREVVNSLMVCLCCPMCSPWCRCPKYGRDVVSYCYLCLCNLCRPPCSTSIGVGLSVCSVAYLVLSVHFKGSCVCFWSYTINSYIWP